MRLRGLSLIVLLVAAFTVAACGSDDAPQGASAGNGTDRAFVDEMVPHHRGAVQMAEVAEQRAESDDVRELADDIIAGQSTEIELMQRVAPSLKDVEPTSLGDHGTMDMGRDVELLRAAEPFDKAFMEVMIPHHQSAIEMAQVQIERGQHEELTRLARMIVEEQKREIEEMRAQLARGEQAASSGNSASSGDTASSDAPSGTTAAAGATAPGDPAQSSASARARDMPGASAAR